MNSRRPSHICTMYVSLSKNGIVGSLIPTDRPTEAPADTDSNNASCTSYP